jgi:MFS family permease
VRAYPVYLFLRAAGSFAGGCALTYNLVYQVETVGLDPLQLVLVGTVLEVTYLLAQLPTGLAADRYGRKPAVVAGTALLGAGVAVQSVPTLAATLLGTGGTPSAPPWSTAPSRPGSPASSATTGPGTRSAAVRSSPSSARWPASAPAPCSGCAACGCRSGLLRSAAAPLLETWLVALTDPATRATALSAVGQADSAGQILGGPPIGALGTRASVPVALAAAALLGAPAIALLARARGRAVRPTVVGTPA